MIDDKHFVKVATNKKDKLITFISAIIVVIIAVGVTNALGIIC